MSSILFAALTLLAQDKQEPNPFENVPLFKHCEVMLRNGNAFKGIVFQVTRPKELGPGAPTHLVLDISEDITGIDGTITFKRDNVKAVRLLPDLTEDARRKRLEEKLKAIEERDKGEQARLMAEAERKSDLEAKFKAAEDEAALNKALTPDEKLKEQQEVQAALQFYNKFPPKDGWGDSKYFELTLKAQNDKSSLSAQEKEFMGNYGQWEKAHNYLKGEGGGGTTPYEKPQGMGPRSTMKTEGLVTTVTISGSPVYE